MLSQSHAGNYVKHNDRELPGEIIHWLGPAYDKQNDTKDITDDVMRRCLL